MTHHAIKPAPGMNLRLASHEYKYGDVPLLCRVIDVVNVVQFNGMPWWLVRAWCANGTPDDHDGWTEREIYVDTAAIGVRPQIAHQSTRESDHAPQ